MSDARQIAETLVNEWRGRWCPSHFKSSQESLAELQSAITAALEAKERELAIAGQCLMEERDRAQSQLDEAVQLLAGCAHIGMFKSKEFGDEVNAFLTRVKGGKS